MRAPAVPIAIVCLSLVACSGPVGPFAGGKLAGTQEGRPVTRWDFAREFDLMEIEVRPEDPYSVKVHYYVVDGRLYLEGGDNGYSRWRPMMWDDPRVRVRFGERVYPATAVLVTDPVEISSVLPSFYEKDADEPSAACEQAWTVEACGFEGRIYRLDSRATG